MPVRLPLYNFEVYPAETLRVATGANMGDPIGPGEAVVPGDTYVLSRGAAPSEVAICDAVAGDPPGAQVVADGSDVGRPGALVRLLACHTLMTHGIAAGTLDMLLLRIGAGAAAGADTDGGGDFVLPLGPVVPQTPMDLITSESAAAPQRFADLATARFIAGTRLTLADGSQQPVEAVAAGDRLLTRDHGAQPVRWIGQQTLRADGALAPVRIRAGTLNVARDLWLSPNHRLFIYQRADRVGAGRAEIMVKAAHLVNGETVTRTAQGFVDAYQLLFDRHEIVFAEGIAVESLLVTNQIRAALPVDVDPTRSTAAEIELARALLEGDPDAAAKLTAASRGRATP